MSKQTELILHRPVLPTLGEFSAVGWTAPSNMSFGEWETIGQTLQYMQGAVNWWVGDWLNEGEKRYGETYAQAIEETGRSYQDLANCKWVAEKVEFSRRLENLSWSHHCEVAGCEKEEQDELLSWASENEASRADLRLEKRRRRNQHLFENTPENPQGKYRIIYADPPWQYSDSGVINHNDNYGRAERHYPTMSIQELCDLGSHIHEISEDNAVLFLWVTSPLLAECFDVIAAWGFKYKTSFVWDKVRHNFGHYNSVRHEFLLVCTRGSCTPDNLKLFDSVQSIERTNKHSEKPPEFREIIDTIYPYGERIELFSRVVVEGWDSWGNE